MLSASGCDDIARKATVTTGHAVYGDHAVFCSRTRKLDTVSPLLLCVADCCQYHGLESDNNGFPEQPLMGPLSGYQPYEVLVCARYYMKKDVRIRLPMCAWREMTTSRSVGVTSTFLLAHPD